MEWPRVLTMFSITITTMYFTLFMDSRLQKTANAFSLKSNEDVALPRCDQDCGEREALCSDMNLTQVPTYLCNDILILDLGGNNIKTLHKTSFTKYASLQELSLSGNNIRTINAQAFYPMKNLMILSLSDNINLHILTSDIFHMSNQLRMLYLSSCSLPYFPNDTLKWLPRLTYLNLQNNRIRFINIMNITECPNEEMTVPMTVVLSYNDIYSLTEQTFRFPCIIGELTLYECPIEHVDPFVFLTLRVSRLLIGSYDFLFSMQVYKDLFTGIAKSSIKSLTLQFPNQNNLSFTVPQDFFYPLANCGLSNLKLQGKSLHLQAFAFNIHNYLDELTITDTSIVMLLPEYFDGLSKLQALILTGNEIVNFNPEHSRWNLEIRLMNLSHNNIEHLSKAMFTGLKCLEALDLSDNPRLFAHAGRISLSNLESLDISRTSIDDWDAQFPNLRTFSFSGGIRIGISLVFQKSPLLVRIILDNSHFTVYDLCRACTDKSIFQGLHHLKCIDLNSNDLKSLPRVLFLNLPALIELNLRNNKISSIESGAFTGLQSLERLYLDNNLLSEFTRDGFGATMAQLDLLHLNSNLLRYLDKDLFVNTPKLTHLRISNNQFTILNQSTFIPIRSTLRFIDISENPVHCSCQMKWLMDWKKSAMQIGQINQTMCSFTSEAHFSGKSVFMVNPNYFCSSHVKVYCTLSITALLLFLMSVVYLKKGFARYKIFLLKLAIRGYEEIQDNRDPIDYEFDLNIFFTDKDEDWARRYLQPKIKEYLPHFDRVVLGDDDLPLGMYYVEAVLHVIERSFKIILLLSRAACRDNKFMMKLRATLNHMTNTRSQCTLLIFLENIPDEELPHLVRLYLSEERPYLFWFEDEKDNNYFLIKFAKVISANVQRNDLIPPE